MHEVWWVMLNAKLTRSYYEIDSSLAVKSRHDGLSYCRLLTNFRLCRLGRVQFGLAYIVYHKLAK